ncbi:MAG TPA: heavy metal-associated domain-containing protein [Steroidobacteraceae bacterium]|nr:heavy metal-associated domain-containing protein [Steroidobacteraceae bacterium]
MTTRSSNEDGGAIVLTISGMTCGGCAGAVGRALSQVPGVAEARVDLSQARATVTGTARAEDLIRAVEAAGFSGGLA